MTIFFFSYVFFFSMMTLILVRKHYLMSLISLELIFIILFIMFFFYLNFFLFEYFFGLIYLILGVCEASMGLTILVYLVRSVGFDYLNIFNLC